MKKLSINRELSIFTIVLWTVALVALFAPVPSILEPDKLFRICVLAVLTLLLFAAGVFAGIGILLGRLERSCWALANGLILVLPLNILGWSAHGDYKPIAFAISLTTTIGAALYLLYRERN